MKRNVLIFSAFFLAVLSACERKPPETVLSSANEGGVANAVAGGTAEVQEDATTDVELIDAASVKEFNPLRRENGTWTEKGCAWTIADNKESQEVAHGEEFLADGYFLTYESADPGNFEFALLGDSRSYGIPVRTNYDRPDVAEYFKSANALHTGYRFSTKLSNIVPGSYKVDLFYQVDGVDFFCETGKTLIVQ